MPCYEKSKLSGLWTARFREQVNGITKYRRLSGFKTKKEAQFAYEDYQLEKKNRDTEEASKAPTPATVMDMKFEKLVELFYAFKKSRIRDASYYDITKKIERRILPFFRDYTLKEITPAKILEWMNTLTSFSYNYVKSLTAILAGIYNYAEKYYDVPNVMNKVDRPRNLEKKKEMLVWTPEEFSAFIKEVSNQTYKLFFKFLFLSGCRRGEALALTWEDINLQTGAINISKSIAFKGTESDKAYRITPPKNTSSNRIISLPQSFIKELSKYRKELFGNSTTRTNDFVFGKERPLPATSIDRTLRMGSEKAQVKRIRVHDFRHSFASILIHRGVSIVAVSKTLGHSSVEETLNTYSHIMPDDKEMILKNLESLCKTSL